MNSNLLKLTSNNLETKIYVQADKALDYGRVMGVVSAISAIGFSKVILVTEIIKWLKIFFTQFFYIHY